MSAPLISISKLRREFRNGEEVVAVLKDVDLTIERGEMIAIMGASGSGKSTLMNILGCLDRASAGTYEFEGRDVAAMDADELAELRREHFGFIFQRYQLLPDLDAVQNVEVPAIYAGMEAGARQERAVDLLTRLGLGDRLDHRPSELSGGQQQRVSVARALMNGGEVILADEPTGALDKKSGEDLMALLEELHADGHTVILVTHDQNVASRAERIVEISDGRIIADRRQDEGAAARSVDPLARPKAGWREGFDRGMEVVRTAVRAMRAHKLRTFLTMLGIIIGIASVVSVVALGQGSQQAVLAQISSIGTNTITIAPGSGFGDRTAGRIRTLLATDADALARQPYADSVTPRVSSNGTALFGNLSVTTSITGVGPDYFRVSGTTISQGSSFGQQSVDERAQDAVIDTNAVSALFPNGENPIGQVIVIGKVPVRVIGVATTSGFGPGASNANVYLPYTTVMDRILGRNYLSGITIRVADTYDMDTAEAEITALLVTLHGGTQDFFLQNSNTIRDTIQSTSQTLTLLISAIAVISLVVGGIGVMNIMLVSVSERTKEIGIRMAVGARGGDILQQFLVEAVLVCFIGGAAGIGLSFAVGAIVKQFVPTITLSYSPLSIVVAVLSSTAIGLAFGFFPARSASRLDPVDALARE
ncbi:macrolide export ATP-binding/permease protein MacB [Youhaiella tibetensis]|uniref:Pyoverdine export ATP-binding/permease protein PvdT n=1 Tax=Paradevosia tibetensis TaxID=1447062 RepID=A0A5B9DJP6_9HYPH|nr:MacB family efflux pump subunit [Youhaiella tibetensis]AKR58489.1 Macrolide export ATP-binding/permease protein MacB [Devosia sp. H5989]QEE19353.1 MacB family efflux pump subunit [Youhaiella tibetensis]GGF33966.1 macrolide export ATP-binding/permease protein MacB [Youhaiella tibetensis]